MAEIVRAGILSVERGPDRGGGRAGHDAAAQIMRRIVLPQAMRVIIPPTGNELISMLKTTSLVVAVPLTPISTPGRREIAHAGCSSRCRC